MKFNKNYPVLIIGGSSTVENDLENLENLIYPHKLEDVFYICVINDQISNWTKRVDIFASLHGEKIEEKWLYNRPINSNWDFITYVHRIHTLKEDYFKKIPIYEVKDRWRGSSGLYAVQVCFEQLGLEKIVLAGVPMDEQPNYFRDEKQWKQFSKYRAGWIKALKEKDFDLKKIVRSMSGWTKEQFDEPDKKFILGEN